MFNLGMTEILVLGALALIVIGPEQMPELARSVARVLNEFKKATGELTSSLSRIKSDTRESIQSVVAQAKKDNPLEVITQMIHGKEHEKEKESKSMSEEKEEKEEKENQPLGIKESKDETRPESDEGNS